MSPSFVAQALSIEGADALAFAHAQFSSDVASLAVGRWQFSAWLDAQGRVRALFHLARLDEHRLLLLLRGGEAEAFCAALQRYVFRMQLAIDVSPWPVLATGPSMRENEAQLSADGVLLGCGDHSLQLLANGESDNRWRSSQLASGWPWLPSVALNKLLPPALSLHRLRAVAVNKGCYPGQEIVARLHWRGEHKRHLCEVNLDRPVEPGTLLRRDGRDIGMLLGVDDGQARASALAVVAGECSAPDTAWQLDSGPIMRVLQRWDA